MISRSFSRRRVFDAIPAQLAKPDKRFVLAYLEHGASRRKYADPTQWLMVFATCRYIWLCFYEHYFNLKLYDTSVCEICGRTNKIVFSRPLIKQISKR